jgi:hypothetical protein
MWVVPPSGIRASATAPSGKGATFRSLGLCAEKCLQTRYNNVIIEQ